MLLAFLLVVSSQSGPVQRELAGILQRFTSQEPKQRDAASIDLNASCRKAGSKAVD